MFKNSLVALLTPFTAQGAIDWPALEKLIAWHIACGTDGLVPCGTTGESPTLSAAEHKEIIRFCVEQAKGQIPIMAGCGSNNTAEAVEFTQDAQACGADAALLISPYYNKPTQEGIYQHYKAIHEASNLPLYLYDVPSRTKVEIADETVVRLAALPRVVGLKDATADLSRPMRLKRLLLQAGYTDFCLLSGEDATALAFMLSGGHGCISVTANVAPRQCGALYKALEANDLAQAQEINQALIVLHDALFCETSPIPVKYAAHKLGLCANTLRLPLVPASQSAQAAIDAAMAEVDLKP